MKIISGTFRHIGIFLRRYKQDSWIILVMVIVTILISAPAYTKSVRLDKNDYSGHVQLAQSIIDKHRHLYEIPISEFSHPVYQILLIGFYYLAFKKIGLYTLAIWIQIAVQVLTVLVLYFWFGEWAKKNWLRALLSITLVLVTPVMILAFWDKLYYLGYIGLTTYHNPTILLLRPVAVISFICSLRIFSSASNSWKLICLSAFLIVLSALIKPNYVLCLLPAVSFMAGLCLILKKPFSWRLFLLGFFLPGAVILLVEWVIAYLLPSESAAGGILINAFGVMEGYSKYLLPKFFLSILFPLSVVVLNFNQVKRDNTFLLAWLGFLVSLVQTYFLAEGGKAFFDGNFLWGSQIMLFILFVVSARFLWQEMMKTGLTIGHKEYVVFAAYAVHLCAGLVYYVHVLTYTAGSPF